MAWDVRLSWAYEVKSAIKLPAGGFAQANQGLFHRALVIGGIGWFGNIVDQVKQGGIFVIERRTEGQLVGGFSASRLRR